MRGRSGALSWFMSFIFILFLTLAGCGGGGGGGEESTATNPPGGEETTVSTSSASVLALVDTTTAGTRADTETVEGTATLIVDLNGDGVFDDSATGDDRKYETVIKDGQVSFVGVEVNAEGMTKAKLSLKKDGRAPYEKILELSPETTFNVKVETAPVEKITVSVPSATSRDAGGYLVFGVYRAADGTQKPFVRTSARRDGADVTLSGTEAAVAIPVDVLQEAGVTRVTASMQAFDGTKDRQQFPGEFVGTYANRADDEKVALQSVSFAYLKLEDQNGNDLIQETMKRLAGEVGMTVTLNVPCDALQVIKDKGDDDATQAGVQVPLWTYNYNTGTWTWVGEGTLYGPDNNPVRDVSQIDTSSCSEGDYYVQGIIEVANWGDYVNLDYPVVFTEPKTVCLTIKDQNGNPISGAYVYASDDTYVDSFTDDNGLAKLSIFSDPSNYTFAWSSQLTGYLDQTIANVDIAPSLTEGCDYEVTVTYTNPYTARVKARVLDKDGNPISGQYVEIWSSSSYYWNSGTTDANGEVEFPVQPNVSYTVWAANQQKDVEVNGTIDNDEKSDNGSLAVLEFQKENTPPQVSVYVYPSQVAKGGKVRASIYAWDADGDNLILETVSVFSAATVVAKRNNSLECTQDYAYSGNVSWTCEIDTSTREGNYTIYAAVSDGHVEQPVTGEASFTVYQSLPPQIYAIHVEDDQGNYASVYNLRSGQTYTFHIYAWDPDGDSNALTYQATLNGQSFNDATFTWEAPACDKEEGCTYTLAVTVTDADQMSAQKSETITVYGNRSPEIYGAGTLATSPVAPGSTITVFAYAWDPDGSLDTSSFAWTVDGNPVAVAEDPVPIYDGYYYEVQIQLPSEAPESGIFNVCLTVTDADGATFDYCFPVFAQEPNTPPLIESGLPENLALTAGESHTFTVSAYDPDGDPLTYTWYVNGQQVGAGNTLTYTFQTSGDYNVECVISDGKVQVTTATMVVVTGGESADKIIMHFGISGVYVSRNDPNTLQPVEVKQTDDNGNVEFDNVDEYNVISVGFTPDMRISKDYLFAMIVNDVFDTVYDKDFNRYDPMQVVQSGCISVEDLKALAQNDPPAGMTPDEAQQAITAVDQDQNGCLDVNECWNLTVAIFDQDHDGHITMKELGVPLYVQAMLFQSVPTGEYDMTNVFSVEDLGNSLLKEVNITIQNMAAESSVAVYGPEDTYAQLINMLPEVRNVTGQIVFPYLQSDGLYSLIFVDPIHNVFGYLLDQNSSQITVDYNSFQAMKNITFLNFDCNTPMYIRMYGWHKDVKYALSGKGLSEDGNFYVADVPFDKFMLDVSRGSEGMVQKIYVVFDSIPDQIDWSADPYTFLDVNVIPDPNGGYDATGNDVSKVTEYSYEKEVYVGSEDQEAHLDILFWWYGSPSTVVVPDYAQVFPEAVVNYIQEVNNMVEPDANNASVIESLDFTYWPDVSDLNDLIYKRLNGLDEISSHKEVWVDLSFVQGEQRR